MAAKKPLHNTLRDKAEAKVKKLPLSALDLTMEKARVMMHELEVHQVELEMQNQELREAQHRLEEARDQYTDLFDFAPIGYLILDKKGVINNINLTACNLLGIERVHLKGKPLSAYMFSGEANKLLLKLRKAFKTGTLPALELHLKRNGNKDFTALIHGIVVVGGNQDNPLCRIAMQDVTELREAEALQQRHEDLQREKESIQQYNEELEAIVKKRTKELSEALEAEKQINEMKSAFITIASHELRTPITIIKSSVILIEKFKNLGRYDKIDPHVEHIKSSINNFTAILDDFLSLEKFKTWTTY
jgi:PAS domain S-box-containing protein